MERLLDVSALEPPEPLTRILDALDDLQRDDWLRIRHRREPYPLYGMLRDMGFAWRTDWNPAGLEILVWHDDRPPPPVVEGGEC
jgi:hypothetical protein